jgi:hypothetical protein
MDYARDVAFLNTALFRLPCAICHEPCVLRGEFSGGHRIPFRLLDDLHHQVGHMAASGGLGKAGLPSNAIRHNGRPLILDGDSHNSGFANSRRVHLQDRRPGGFRPLRTEQRTERPWTPKGGPIHRLIGTLPQPPQPEEQSPFKNRPAQLRPVNINTRLGFHSAISASKRSMQSASCAWHRDAEGLPPRVRRNPVEV